jgi:hypothetical protein
MPVAGVPVAGVPPPTGVPEAGVPPGGVPVVGVCVVGLKDGAAGCVADPAGADAGAPGENLGIRAAAVACEARVAVAVGADRDAAGP